MKRESARTVVAIFLVDACAERDGIATGTTELYTAFTKWCTDKEMDVTVNRDLFAQSVRAIRGVKAVRIGHGPSQRRAMPGLALKGSTL